MEHDEQIRTIGLLGLRFAALTRAGVVDRVFGDLARSRGGWLGTLNLDYLRRCAGEPDTRRRWERAELLVADGLPLVWAARAQGTPLPERVAGSDLVWLLAERAAAEGRSLYLLGGEPGAAEGALRELHARWPNLRVVGVSSPRVSRAPTADELAALRRDLVEAAPDLVYVALGAPKEERVIEALRGSLPASWWVGVGVSLGFMSGQVRRAPRWVQRIGLEWLHRLAQEPTRLARRYLVEDLPFAVRLLAGACLARLRSPQS